ncbi:MAG: DNA polymerase III subunit alpha [Candidatus Nanopelagicaceae bacterium]|nr:DNA polymerase III subunit alpha [Candidatus Nanopelagicaceae bacterium]
MSFTHLHVASGFSFKYGTTLPDALVARARDFGMPSIALTDRDGLSGAIRFTQSCLENQISPIIGVDISYENQTRITLLATPGKGWSSLVRVVTQLKNYGAPCDLNFLKQNSKYTQNLLALYGPDSEISRALTARRYDKALLIFNSTRDLFLDQSIECVSHLIYGDGPKSTTHAARMLNFARDHDLPAVLTNAVRMKSREDAPIADVLDATRHLLPLHKKVVERKNAEAFLKNSDEMVFIAEKIAAAAGERNAKQLLKTTTEWAERAVLSPHSDIGLGSIHLPEPHVVGAKSQPELTAQLRARAYAGVNWRYGGPSSEVEERLNKELSIIASLGYESYFLTVADITDRARNSGIRVAARGSGAGSLVCHLLGISGVEPLSLGLLMERFCSPLRKALPDIDIDVESARRLEIYDQVFESYQQRCATVAMFDKYRARHAIRDVGAALSLPPMEIDLVAKSLPHIRARNISQALENLPELKNLNLTSGTWKMAVGLAERLDGLPRNLAMHPCAVVISDIGLYDRAPIETNASNYPMVQWDKDDVEAIGLLKLDILGVRMQSALAYSASEIKRTTNLSLDLDAIPLDDPKTFELIQSTKTLGLFQIESPGQRELVGKFAPQSFTDLIIDISLFRPGPVKSDMITPFLNARQGWKAREIFHPDLLEILDDTEGVVVFHEQVIEIIATLGGVTLAEADEKRRALGDKEGQQEVCDWFFPAATARGYSLEVVTKMWEVLRAFASFGFCKAHAAAFALPTYQSAWLKAHYPAAFLAGVLTHDPGMYPKRLILDEARRFGVKIEKLDINKSDRSYRVENDSSIRLALADVSGISEGEIDAILSNRPFVDLADFVHRSGVSRPTCEALLMVGAFDALYPDTLNHRDLLLHLNDLYKWSRTSSKALSNLSGSQLTFGFTPELSKTGLPNLLAHEKVRNEIEFLGMDVSHHMMEFYADFLNQIGAVKSSDLIKQRSNSSVLVAGVKVILQTPPIRSGKRVIFVTLDDGNGCSDATFFEDAQRSYAETLYNSKLLLVRGNLRRTGARGVSIRATGAWDLSAAYEKWRNLALCE